MPLELTPSSSQHELIKDGWFSEKEAMWPGQKFTIEVDEVLANGRSDFQDILVFKSKTYGNVLILDGVIQVTERDEFAYQEMIAHLPLFACPNPKRVLIIGGGDGGVLREVVKHSSVEEIVMCEIDRQVIEVGKTFFRETLSTAFGDSRLNLVIDDAAKYVRTWYEEKVVGAQDKQYFDVIICDSSDPVGPADVLFQPEFFLSLQRILNPVGGVLTTQGECIYLHLDLIERVIKSMRKDRLFESVQYAYTMIPTYPSGQIGFMVATLDSNVDVSKASRPVPEGMKTSYYTSDIHSAAFVLPKFAAEKLSEKK
eukprot:gene3148-3447_t